MKGLLLPNGKKWHKAEASLMAAMAQTADIPTAAPESNVDPNPPERSVDVAGKMSGKQTFQALTSCGFVANRIVTEPLDQ